MAISGNLRDIAKPSVIITLQKNLAAEIKARILADEVLQDNIDAAISTPLPPSKIAQDSDNRFVSDEQISRWDVGGSGGGRIRVDGKILHGSTIVDVVNGKPTLRPDGEGDYLLAVTFLGKPYLKYIGRDKSIEVVEEYPEVMHPDVLYILAK